MATISLTKGQVAIVDDADFDWLSQWKWSAQKVATISGFYAVRWMKKPCGGMSAIPMHRFINGTPDGAHTDHIDGNGLNNCRSNLRTVTALQNQMNKRPNRGGTSPLKGAWRDDSCRNVKKWRSSIRINGRLKYLGRFHTDQEAAAAYAKAAAEHFGEYHRTAGGE